jgi:hypothetical protein
VLAARMPLGEMAGRISCPVLYGIVEFDKLTRLEQAIASFERIRAPKELRVYEDEFHPLGGVAAEVFRFGAEWLERAWNGGLAEPRSRRALSSAATARKPDPRTVLR